jgi:hypothetical protein
LRASHYDRNDKVKSMAIRCDWPKTRVNEVG